MTARRPENERLTPDPLRELLGSDEIQQPRAAFRARLRSDLMTQAPAPTGWNFALPNGRRLAPATSALAKVLLVSFTAFAAYFFTDNVLRTEIPEAEVDAPVLVEPDLEAPQEGVPASDQSADGASRGDDAREAPGGPGLDAEAATGADLGQSDSNKSSDLSEDGASSDANAPLSPPINAPGNQPGVAPVAPASTPEAPAPPAEEPADPPPVRDDPEEPEKPRKQPTDPPIAPTEEPEAQAPQPTPTDYVAPGRETRPPLPSPTPEPSETPTEEPAPIAPHSAG